MNDKPKSKPTSFDVAERAGVHRSIVSRALAGTGRMSDATRGKIVDAANELGYRVNFLARGLQGHGSGLVGIIASRLDTPYRASQVKFAAHELIARGFTPLLIVAEGGRDIEGLIERLLNYTVMGMIVTSDTPPVAIIQECADHNVPVVLINRDASITDADRVQLDINASAQLAYQMLYGTGGKDFATLVPSSKTYSVNGRAEAFATLCKADGYRVLHVETSGQSYADGVDAADEFVALGAPSESIFATTDLLAMGFMDGLRFEHGIDVPENVQIVGFDDVENASWLSYQLSTIRQDSAETAKLCVELIEARIANPSTPFQTMSIPISPIYRKTTRPPL